MVVTGESPIVDVQSARQAQVIAGGVLSTLPTSRSYNNVLQLVPSVVAGDGNIQLRPTMLLFTAHGGSTQDGRLTVDGVNTGSSRGGSGVSSYVPDVQNATEVVFSISGNLGEAETGGPQMTVVPKTGGNVFNGSFFANGVNEAMQGSNFTDRLRGDRPDGTAEGHQAVRRAGLGRRPDQARHVCGSSTTSAASDRPMRSPASSPTRTPATRRSGTTSPTCHCRAAPTSRAISTRCD